MTFEQSFAWWSFTEEPRDENALLEGAREIGYLGVDFLPEPLWPVARSLGMTLVIIDGHAPLEVGFNDPANHGDLREQVSRALDVATRNDVAHLAVTSGDRMGISDAEAVHTCAQGLAPVVEQAEQAGVVLLMENLNSRVDHPGHQSDLTSWVVELVDVVGSRSLRLAYDFYHSQIMGEDLLRTAGKYWDRISHVQTAGAPGRGDIGRTQEIDYPAVADWLESQGYTGFVGHEFVPRGEPLAALRDAYDIFDVGAPSGTVS